MAGAVGNTSECRPRGRDFEPKPGHITFVEIDHEIISTAILPLLQIQEGQLAVTGKSMCTQYWLTTLSSEEVSMKEKAIFLAHLS